MNSGNPLVDYSQYEAHYQEVSKTIANEPVQSRNYTDCGCAVVFLIIFGLFLGLGTMEIIEYQNLNQQLAEPGNLGDQTNALKNNAAIIAAGVGTSLVVSFLYVLLLKAFPKTMVYLMIGLTLAVLAGLALFGLFTDNLGLLIGMGVTFMLYLLLICCLRNKIKIGIALVRVASNFVSQRLQIFVAPLIQMILSLVLVAIFTLVLGTTIYMSNYKQSINQSNQKQIGLMTFWGFCWTLFTFVFYYMMAYVISVVCSYWYYKVQGGSILTAYQWMFRQFGSIVFAAMLIAIVTVLRGFAQSKSRNNKNLVVAICLCFVSCLLKCVEDLLKVINHFTVIMMGLTGQDFISSAKTTIGLIWKQIGLLSVTNTICSFLTLWGLIISIGIPCIVTLVLMKAKTQATNDQVTVVVVVALCSLLIGTMVFEIVVESVSCIFMYYTLDKDLYERALIQQCRMEQQYRNQICQNSIEGNKQRNERFI